MSKKGENIYKRKDGRWEARYIKDYRPDGKAVYGYCYGKTYRETKIKLSEKVAMIKAGQTEYTTGNNNFAPFIAEWLTLKRSRVKESTYVKYEIIIKNHISPYFSYFSIDMLTEAGIEAFSHFLFCEKQLSAKTVKDILVVLNSIIKYVARQRGTFCPPEITYPKEGKKGMRILTLDEQKTFMDYLRQDTDCMKFGVLLALCTGMRIGEVCALKWSDISMDSRCIRVSSTMQRLRNTDADTESKTKIVITEPKSDTSSRLIPMSDYVFSLCRSMYSDDSSYVLSGSESKFIEPRHLQYQIKKYAKACNLEDIHFHTLRHTFATRCVEVGFEIKSLSEILGHYSPKITLERYVHTSIELKRDNIRKLECIGI